MSPAVSDVAGAPVSHHESESLKPDFSSRQISLWFFVSQYRACAMDSLKSLVDGDCRPLFDGLLKCQNKNEYDYGKKCHTIRRSLLECAVKNKIGELGKNYAV